ncbi:MAG: DNA polymerase III subunit gamma/tau [Armatimonadota bacterium]
MTYVSLYRKYRSQTFSDVMGQDHVVKTLQNAIRLGKVAHAYLFCGTRGTGKTTTARLLAKAINCESGPTTEPCNTCPACLGITEGSAMDIVELDAASHRSIRDVEDIRENVKFPPMELRYKVFIIDEAHQLSSDAKDAFLKTLEEPPAHAIFILATTEPQSIPITIRSRCQQFDFRRGSLRDIRERLRYVVESEGVKAEEAALDLVAANADGSWRDSLSLLEQVLAYTDGEMSVDDVNTVLGTVTQDFLFQLADTLADGDERGAFEAAEHVMESGKEIPQLLRSIAQHFRDLLFATVSKDSGGRLCEQTSKWSKRALLSAVETFTEAERDARMSDQHRLLLELALLKVIETVRPGAEAPVEPRPEPPAERPRPKFEPPAGAPKPTPKPEPAQVPKAEAPAKPRSAPSGEQNLPEFVKIEEKWNLVLQHLRSISVAAHGLLTSAKPVEVRNGSLVLQFEGEGQKNLIENETAKGRGITKKQALLTALERVFGVTNAGLICQVASASGAAMVPPPEAPENDLPDPFSEGVGQQTMSDVFELFPNAEIMDGGN